MDYKEALKCWHRDHPLKDTECLPAEMAEAITRMYNRTVENGINECSHCGDGFSAIREIDKLNWFIMGWKNITPDVVKNEISQMNREKDPEWILYQELRKKFEGRE